VSSRDVLPGGKYKGASMATSLGEFRRVCSMISLSVKNRSVFTAIPFNRQNPVGLVSTAAKSKPTIDNILSSSVY